MIYECRDCLLYSLQFIRIYCIRTCKPSGKNGTVHVLYSTFRCTFFLFRSAYKWNLFKLINSVFRHINKPKGKILHWEWVNSIEGCTKHWNFVSIHFEVSSQCAIQGLLKILTSFGIREFFSSQENWQILEAT